MGLLAAGAIDVSRTDVNLSRNLLEASRAELQAEAATNVAIYALLNVGGADEAWKSDGSIYAWKNEGVELRVRITEEGGRVDLNESSPEILASLFRAAGLEATEAQDLANAVVDFRDSDQDRRPGGAEDEDYDTRRGPLGAKDEPFEAVEELLRVPGMTVERYRRIAPALTLLTSKTTPNPESATPLVTAALEGRVLDWPTAPDADLPPPRSQRLEDWPVLVREGSGRTGTSRGLYRIEAQARLIDGTSYSLQTIVRLNGRDTQPYQILQRGRAEPNFFPLETESPHTAR
ncbi:MAG: general secretion pathway protein GspK [Desulfuromonadales bacterium]|nr:general secretion pathway protein GspK [Desulfuromonadales bacterium]